MVCQLSFYCQKSKNGQIWDFFQKNRLKFSTTIFFLNGNFLVYDINPFHMRCKISLHRNAEIASKHAIFRKLCLKFVKNKVLESSASFSCRGCQALSPDMRIIIQLLIMEEWAFLLVLKIDGQAVGPTLFWNFLVVLIPMV